MKAGHSEDGLLHTYAQTRCVIWEKWVEKIEKQTGNPGGLVYFD
jgi:hypothetical protein